MDSGEWGRAHLDLPGVCIPWIALQPGWGGHGGEGRARRRLQPRMPSARKKPSALGNSGTARALSPEIREQRSATPQIREQSSATPPNSGAAQPPLPRAKGGAPNPGFGRDLWLGDGKTELGMGFLGQPRGGSQNSAVVWVGNPKMSTGTASIGKEMPNTAEPRDAAKFQRGLGAQIQLVDAQTQTIPDAGSITS